MSNIVKAVLRHLLELGRIRLRHDDEEDYLPDDDLRQRWQQELAP